MDNEITELLKTSMNSIKDMIEANTIIGSPINYNNAVIIPISRLRFTFLSGGSDIKPNSNKNEPLFGGASGGAASIVPIAFLVVRNNDISLLSIDNHTHIVEKMIDEVPLIVDKVKALFNENIKITKV